MAETNEKNDGAIEEYLTRWNLEPDGPLIVRPGSHLLPVRLEGAPAVLKVARDTEERVGGQLMQWWSGQGAAHVFAGDENAIVMERAEGARDLLEMARSGQDEEATRILCRAAVRLHAVRSDSEPPPLVPLREWFASLWPAAQREGGLFLASGATARELFATPRDEVVLHGDIHHGNVLDFGPRGWLAIDPKG